MTLETNPKLMNALHLTLLVLNDRKQCGEGAFTSIGKCVGNLPQGQLTFLTLTQSSVYHLFIWRETRWGHPVPPSKAIPPGVILTHKRVGSICNKISTRATGGETGAVEEHKENQNPMLKEITPRLDGGSKVKQLMGRNVDPTGAGRGAVAGTAELQTGWRQ
jgi:hypothetical protein